MTLTWHIPSLPCLPVKLAGFVFVGHVVAIMTPTHHPIHLICCCCCSHLLCMALLVTSISHGLQDPAIAVIKLLHVQTQGGSGGEGRD
jgi:hypothetical protein